MSSTTISTSEATTGQKVLVFMIVLIVSIVLIYGRKAGGIAPPAFVSQSFYFISSKEAIF